MTEEIWDRVDRYFTSGLLDDDFSWVLEKQSSEGLPDINVTAMQGQLLYILSKTVNARNVLELGTLGGYSSIWLARSIQEGGKVITLELSEKHASVARKNLEKAGLSGKVEIRVGSALDSLPRLEGGEHTPFDLVFIDADKANIPEYFDWALKLTRTGSLIVVDNTVRDGRIIDSGSDDSAIQGVRKLVDKLGQSDRVDSTCIQTVGTKGYDGFILMRVR